MTDSTAMCPVCHIVMAKQPDGALFPHKRLATSAGPGPDLVWCEGGRVTPSLIRWEPAPATEGGSYGFVATFGPAAFKVLAPDRSEGERHWLLHVCIAPAAIFRYGETEADAKQQAGTWLREFVSSLGALFACDLREHLTGQAAIHQGLGDGHDEMGHNITSREHWAAARALAEVGKWLDHELETRQ